MHDIKFIRTQPALFDAAMQRRGLTASSAAILELDEQRRKITTEAQQLQARRNELSKKIGEEKKAGRDAAALQAQVTAIKERLPELEQQEQELATKQHDILAQLPNMLADDVPDGKDESANKVITVHGSKPTLASNKPLAHDDLGTRLQGMDFTRAAKIAGARFVVLRGHIAKLERALANFMLDIHTKDFGYEEINVPLLVNSASVYGTAQLPKFADDLFQTTDGRWLIPTAEVSLTNLVADEIIDASTLPLRFTAWTPCFRSEAGAAGRDTRGMIRQHQFSKVELVSVVAPEHSDAEQQRMRQAAETVLQRLGLHYRVQVLCAGDTGFASRRTYDIEVWLPGQNDGQGAYREISSCSSCGDFQARRMNARLKDKDGNIRFVHTLNGSGLALGRTLVAILENYQQADGSIMIPPALQPYTGFTTIPALQ